MLQDDVVQHRAVSSRAASKKSKTATSSSSSADLETTFDVDGHVETIAGQPPIDNQSVEPFMF